MHNKFKKAVAFLLPIFTVLMYVKAFFQAYWNMPLSNDVVFTIVSVNVCVLVTATIVIIFDINHLFKGEPFFLEADEKQEGEDTDIEEIFRGKEWSYSFTYDYVGNEVATYRVKDFVPTQKELKLLKEYEIYLEGNITVLTYRYE